MEKIDDNYPNKAKQTLLNKVSIMKTYIFKTQNSSDLRGYNRTIYVYRVKNNKPEFIGYDEEIHTASYKGDRAIAAKIIHETTGAKWLKGREGYELASKQIQIFEI